MSSKKDQFERDFDAFLNDGDAQLSALYAKLPQAEPDAKLDAAVLAMAHRALNPHLVATPSPRRGSAARRHARWLPVFGAAATVVFAVGVALTMGPQLWTQRSNSAPEAVAHDAGVIHVRPVDTPPAVPEPPLSPPPPAASAVAPERQELARSALKPAPPPAEAFAKQAAPAPQPPAPPPPPAHESPAPPVAAEAPAATPAYEPQRLEAQRLQPSAPAPQAAAPSAPARSSTEMDAVERKEAIAEGAWQRLHENDVAPSAKSARTDSAAGTPTAPAAADSAGSLAATAPKPAANAASAPAAAAARSTAPADGAANAPAANPFPAPADSNERRSFDERRARVEAEKKKLQDEEARRAGGVAAAPAKPLAEDKPAPTAAKAEIPAALAAHPQDWVAAMQKMLRDGRGDELRNNLTQFRQRYPNYRLPADLDRFAHTPR